MVGFNCLLMEVNYFLDLCCIVGFFFCRMLFLLKQIPNTLKKTRCICYGLKVVWFETLWLGFRIMISLFRSVWWENVNDFVARFKLLVWISSRMRRYIPCDKALIGWLLKTRLFAPYIVVIDNENGMLGTWSFHFTRMQ